MSETISFWETIGVWVEAIALIAIFVLDWKERKENRKERKEQHEETYAQLQAAQSQADASKKSADAATAGAAAAIATVKLMRKISRKELRARVFVASAQRVGPPGPGSFTAEVSIKNFGKIPAYDCTYFATMVLRPNPNNEFPTLHKKGDEPMLVLPPDAEVKMPLVLHTGTFQNMQDTNVGTGSWAVYIYGEIQYRDGFAKGRTSTFCMKCCGFDYPSGRFAFNDKGNQAT